MFADFFGCLPEFFGVEGCFVLVLLCGLVGALLLAQFLLLSCWFYCTVRLGFALFYTGCRLVLANNERMCYTDVVHKKEGSKTRPPKERIRNEHQTHHRSQHHSRDSHRPAGRHGRRDDTGTSRAAEREHAGRQHRRCEAAGGSGQHQVRAGQKRIRSGRASPADRAAGRERRASQAAGRPAGAPAGHHGRARRAGSPEAGRNAGRTSPAERDRHAGGTGGSPEAGRHYDAGGRPVRRAGREGRRADRSGAGSGSGGPVEGRQCEDHAGYRPAGSRRRLLRSCEGGADREGCDRPGQAAGRAGCAQAGAERPEAGRQ